MMKMKIMEVVANNNDDDDGNDDKVADADDDDVTQVCSQGSWLQPHGRPQLSDDPQGIQGC